MPWKVKGRSAEIVGDAERGAMRPHIDSVLFNGNFIEWIMKSGKSQEEIDDCIRGLCNKIFPSYIGDFRKVYEEFYKTSNETVLSHCLEFKFIRGGYEGTSEPAKGIQYDLKKLLLLGKENKLFSIPFSKKCTLLVFVGHRGINSILEKIKKMDSEYPDLFSQFEKERLASDDEKRCVIRYFLKS
jgi:hypothetical protein